jgi:hypothetical protein
MNNKERMLQICADIKILNHSTDTDELYNLISQYKDNLKYFTDYEDDKYRIVLHNCAKVLDDLTRELVKLVELEFGNN